MSIHLSKGAKGGQGLVTSKTVFGSARQGSTDQCTKPDLAFNGNSRASEELKKATFQTPLSEGYTHQAIQAGLNVYQPIQQEVRQLGQSAFNAVKLVDESTIVRATPGTGKIRGLAIMLGTGGIDRFAGPGNYAPYCRCVDSERRSNGKKKGSGHAKAGDQYLSWAFSEAAHFAVRYGPLAQRFYGRKKAKANGVIAIRAVARKLARATWMMLERQRPYEAKLMFPG